MPIRISRRLRGDDGAIAVVYGIVFAAVMVPLMALGTTTYVRSTTAGELQRAADSGALAGAATIPVGNLNYALDYLDATSGGATTFPISHVGIDYTVPEPLQVACDRAVASASDPANVATTYALRYGSPSCSPAFVQSELVSTAQACASALGVQPPPLPTEPDLTSLLPTLLTPGVQVTLTWNVQGPLDQLLGGTTTGQSATSIARRRFKDMVVVPIAPLSLPTGALDGSDRTTDVTVDLNPYAGDARTYVSGAIDGTEQILRSTPGLGPCAQMLDAARGDVLDAVDPPATGPSYAAILQAAAADGTPVMVAGVVDPTGGVDVPGAVDSLTVPYLEFFPACVDASGGLDAEVGHIGTFGDCTVASPGAFRASLRRS
jgi:hypothetical protein